MPLNDTIVDAVGNANFKDLAEMRLINTNSHHKRLDIIAETALARALDNMSTTSVPEGLGLAAAQRGDLAKQISDLNASISAMQANVKGVQTIPPQTG